MLTPRVLAQVARRIIPALLACICAVVGLGVTAAWAHVRAVPAHRSARVYVTPGTLPLRTALVDQASFTGGNTVAYEKARAAGATYLRIPFYWSLVAPKRRPAGFVATNPRSHGYSWTYLNQIVRSAEAAGLQPILDILLPPNWAYKVKPWRHRAGMPKVADLGQFARALATHFDARHGAPGVHVFQVWNEPNNSLNLSPVRPARYRSMVNAVAAAVHAVDRNDIVLAGGLDPFGHRFNGRFRSESPLAYMRAFFCISKGSHPHATCKTRVHLDAWSHHPYSFHGPFGKADHPDDVSLGDLPKMRALLRTAVRLHRVVSAHPVQFWVTEFSWDTAPPRPHAVPIELQARWTAESLYQMWRSGVSLATWFMLRDEASPSPYQSGLYFHSSSLAKARAKPTLTAFRFPFVAYRGHRQVHVWGRDATGTGALVKIQRRPERGPWRTVALIKANRYGLFRATLRLKTAETDRLRATVPGSGHSLPFSLQVPQDKRYGPWGN